MLARALSAVRPVTEPETVHMANPITGCLENPQSVLWTKIHRLDAKPGGGIWMFDWDNMFVDMDCPLYRLWVLWTGT
jgi:hypothetical protein